MPVVITFDLPGTHISNQDRNRLQSAFTRLGWQNLGGSAYRYPKLGSDEPVEDWMNHVVPALMLFRALCVSRGIEPTKFTLDVQSSSGFHPGGKKPFGRPPATSSKIKFLTGDNPSFGLANLKAWLDDVTWPY